MLTNTALRRKQIAREWSNDVESSDRFVDVGVHLRVVTANPTPGAEIVQFGERTLWVVDQRHYGGMLDTAADPPCIPDGPDGYSQHPQEWFCSEDQFAIIEHSDAEPIGKLALGGMGAGKTTAGVIWLYLRWLENIGTRQEGGITAPTETRLTAVLNEMFDRFPGSWWSYNGETKIVTMADGFRWRGVSTHRQSEKQGSRVQQFNWVALLMDELQDQVAEFVNAQARLRSKLDGRAKRVATATAKDEPEWRVLKDGIIDSGLWMLHTMIGPRSPFIHADHWEAMRKQTSDRDYRRLVLAEDLPPESRLYYTFERKHNLRPIPLGARKITSIVLSRKTGDRRDALLIGHDPGQAKSGSVWLDAYELPQRVAAQHGLLPGEVLWWARCEHLTTHKTHEVHATDALRITRERFGTNHRPDEERAHVRTQPLGMAEDKPDQSVLAIWRRIGFEIRTSQYSKHGAPTGNIPKEARIGMVNTLWCDAAGRRRLFLECDDGGQPATPLLLAAIESMERDDRGRAERDKKDIRYDKSDLPSALGYALWPFEKELATALRADVRRSLGGQSPS